MNENLGKTWMHVSQLKPLDYKPFYNREYLWRAVLGFNGQAKE